MLALIRSIPREDRLIREGRWQTSLGIQLYGRTLGLVGLGKIGRKVARVAQALEMKVIAWSQNLTAEAAAAEAGVTRVDKDELFARKRHCQPASRAERTHPRHRRRARTVADEAERHISSTRRVDRWSMKRR